MSESSERMERRESSDFGSPRANHSPSRSSTAPSIPDFGVSSDVLCPTIQIVGDSSNADELPEEIWTALSRLCCDGSDGTGWHGQVGFPYSTANVDGPTGNRIVIALADSVNIIEASTSSHSISSNCDSEAGDIQFDEGRVCGGESYELAASPNYASRSSLLGRNETHPKCHTTATQTSQPSNTALRADDHGIATAASLGFDGKDFTRKSDPAQEVWKAFQQRHFTDTVVRIDSTQYPCHSVLLCAYSGYFNTLHREGKLTALVHLDKDWVSPEMFESFLDWCYSDSDEATRLINEENVACLSLCARRLGVAVLKQQCYQFISMLSSLPSSMVTPHGHFMGKSLGPFGSAEISRAKNEHFMRSPPFMRSAERIPSSKPMDSMMAPFSTHDFRHALPSPPYSLRQVGLEVPRDDSMLDTNGDPMRLSSGIHRCSLDAPTHWSLPTSCSPKQEDPSNRCANPRPFFRPSPRCLPQFSCEQAGSFEHQVQAPFPRSQGYNSDCCMQNQFVEAHKQRFSPPHGPKVTSCPSFPIRKQGSLNSSHGSLPRTNQDVGYYEPDPHQEIQPQHPTGFRRSREIVNRQYSSQGCSQVRSSDFNSPAGTIYHSASSGLISPSAADNYQENYEDYLQGNQMYSNRVKPSREDSGSHVKSVSSRHRRRMKFTDDSCEENRQGSVGDSRNSPSWLEPQDPRDTSSSLGDLQQSVLKEVTRVFGHDRRLNEDYDVTRSFPRPETGNRHKQSTAELDETHVNEITPSPRRRIPGGSAEDSRHATCVGSVENSLKVGSHASDDRKLLWAMEQESSPIASGQGSSNEEPSSAQMKHRTPGWTSSKPTMTEEMRNIRCQPPSLRHLDPSADECLDSKASTSFNSAGATSKRHVSFHGVIDSTFDFTPVKDTHTPSMRRLLGSTGAYSKTSASEASLNRTSCSDFTSDRGERSPQINRQVDRSNQWQRSTPSQNSSMQSMISSHRASPSRPSFPNESKPQKYGKSDNDLSRVDILDDLSCHPPKSGAGIPDIISRLMKDHPSVLVFGGMNPMMGSGFTAESASYVLQYFPHLERWWGVTRLPEPRVHFSTVFYRGCVYVAGGGVPLLCSEDGDQPNPSAKCWMFKPDTGAWEALTDMPEPRMHHTSVVFRRRIYVLGGIGPGNQILSSVLCLNPNKDEPSWEPFPNMGTGRFGLASTCFRGMLWAVGGMTAEFKPTSKVECYHPKRKRWIAGPSLHIPRAFLQLAHADNRLFVVGGAGRSTSVAGTSPLSQSSFTASRSPTPVASAQKSQFAPTALRGMHAVSSIDAWDNELENWVFSLDMEIPCHGHAVVSSGKSFLVVGGLTCKSAHVLQRVARFDCEAQKWTELQPLPYGLTGHSATLLPPMEPTNEDDGPLL